MSDNTQELEIDLDGLLERSYVQGLLVPGLTWENWKAGIIPKLEALIKSQTNQAVVEATRDSELIVSAIARQEGGKVTVSNSALVACSGKVMIEKNPPGIDGLLISELTQEVQTDE